MAVQQQLKAWFEGNGGVLSEVEVGWIGESEGYGLLAQHEIPQGQVVMQVPLDICLHSGVVSRSSLKDVIVSEPQLYDMEDELLALLLMAETRAGEKSYWHPYISSLPRQYDNPLFWSEEELKHLQGTNVALLTRMMASRMEEDWRGVHEVLVGKYPGVLGGLSKEDYVWALSTVWSRAIGIEDEGRYMRCLAPVLDMCNHSPQAASSLDDLLSLDGPSRALQLRSHAPLGRGSQCLMLYGPYTNAKLLFSYGFTVRGNPYLGVDYWVKVPPSCRDADFKAGLLASNPLTANQTYDFTGTIRAGWVSPALLATIRVIQLEPQEYPLADKVLAGEEVSERNERASLGSLLSCVRAKLSTYSTRAEDDRASVEKLERLLDDMAARQRQQAAAGQEQDQKLAGLRCTTRRRLHALRVCLEDKVVFEQAEAMLQARVEALLDQPTA